MRASNDEQKSVVSTFRKLCCVVSLYASKGSKERTVGEDTTPLGFALSSYRENPA
mgnify:FL=1